jgi:hypothetical protein
VTVTRRTSLGGLLAGLTLTAPTIGQPAPTGGLVKGYSDGDVRAFGAKGDRITLDDDAFTRAIAAALLHDQYPGALRLPSGHFRRARAIALPDHAVVRGEGYSSVLNSHGDRAFSGPILTNRGGGAIGWRLADLSLFAGTHGVKLDITTEAANLRFDNVGILLQSVANIEANKLFQTAKFFGGVLGSAPYGLKVDGWTTNAFNSFGLEWTDHSECSLYLRGAENILIIGGRFEGGGQKGKATIDIENGASITFLGVYFENVHEYLARLRRVEVVSFVHCHFTGTHANAPTTLAPFKWDIDANLLVFRDCHSSVPMPVPGNVVLDGVNANIFATGAVHEPHGLHGSIAAAPRAVATTGTADLLIATGRPNQPGVSGRLLCELRLIVAELAGDAATAEWRGRVEIVEQDGRPIMSTATQPPFRIGRLTGQLTANREGRLTLRYHVDGGGPAPYLSWDIDWRRVAGEAQSALSLHVP